MRRVGVAVFASIVAVAACGGPEDVPSGVSGSAGGSQAGAGGSQAGVGGSQAGAGGGVSAGAAGAPSACVVKDFLADLGKDHLLVGGAMTDATLGMAPFDVRYQYLSGGFPDSGTCASCATGCSTKGQPCDNQAGGCAWWGCWQWDQAPPGQFVKDFVSKTKKTGAIPMITYYEQLQDSGASEGKGQLAAMTDPAKMKRYYDDVRFLADTLGDEPALLHLEPDLWGYFQQMGAPDPASVPVAVSTASPECAGLPGDATGFARCLFKIVRARAPHVKIALHASPWATNFDVTTNQDPSLDVAAEAKKLAAYLSKLGAGEADFLLVDMSDRDAGFDQKNGEDTWLDATNTTLPHFHQSFVWVKALGEATGRPILWWQLPLGNASQNDTKNHWKDNRVAYFFSHLDEVRASGVAGILFGAGEPQQTTPESDGGLFVQQSKAYFSSGAVAPLCP